MPRSIGMPATRYPQSDLPNNIPDRCSACQRKLYNQGFILIERRSKTFLYLCANCTIEHLHHPYENKPYFNAIGQELIEVCNGLQIFKVNNQATTIQIEFPTIREARYGVTKIKEVLLMYIQCPCCENMVARLEVHHWWQPPKYTCHTKGVCSSCNQQYLNPKIWEYHPEYDGVSVPSHIMPSWESQKVYRGNKDHKLLQNLLSECEFPLPLPTGYYASSFLGIKYYREYWIKHGFPIYERLSA